MHRPFGNSPLFLPIRRGRALKSSAGQAPGPLMGHFSSPCLLGLQLPGMVPPWHSLLARYYSSSWPRPLTGCTTLAVKRREEIGALNGVHGVIDKKFSKRPNECQNILSSIGRRRILIFGPAVGDPSHSGICS